MIAMVMFIHVFWSAGQEIATGIVPSYRLDSSTATIKVRGKEVSK